MNTTPDYPPIYVVDDDDAFRDSLAWLLETAGYRVLAFPDGASLLRQWRPGGAGCLLLDIRMPGMTGQEVQAELERRRCTAPIIFITGHGDVPMAVTAMQNGAFHFIEKPFNDEALLAIVARALAVGDEQHQRQAHRAAQIARLGRLTPREREVLDCVSAGKANKVTAEHLGVSIKTVEAHRSQLMKKLEVSSTAELVRLLLDVEGASAPESARTGGCA